MQNKQEKSAGQGWNKESVKVSAQSQGKKEEFHKGVHRINQKKIKWNKYEKKKRKRTKGKGQNRRKSGNLPKASESILQSLSEFS